MLLEDILSVNVDGNTLGPTRLEVVGMIRLWFGTFHLNWRLLLIEEMTASNRISKNEIKAQ